MPGDNGGVRGWLGGLADEADGFVQERIDRLAATARERSSEFAEHAAETFARHLADKVAQRLATQLAWAVVAVGSLIIGVWLLALGAAGALGEVMGRPWLGQVVGGAILVLVALVAGANIRARARRRRADDALIPSSAVGSPEPARDDPEPAPDDTRSPSEAALKAGTDLLRRHPVVSLAVLSVMGLLIGSRGSRSRAGHSTHNHGTRSAARPPA
jgi:hypothetical protein